MFKLKRTVSIKNSFLWGKKELEMNNIFTYIHILINSQKGFLKQIQQSLYILLIFTGESIVDSTMEIKSNQIQLKLDENKEIT